jgi:prepilin-type N-terminal cleavage/methylation domain-containing protein
MRQAKRGFTLIELVIVGLLVSLMTAIGILRGARFVDGIEVRGAITEIESLFSLARHIAIARGSQSILEIDAGLAVLTVRSGGEVIRSRDVGEAHGVELITNRSSMTYSPIGVGYGAANFSLVVRRNSVVDTVVISRLGRIRH